MTYPLEMKERRIAFDMERCGRALRRLHDRAYTARNLRRWKHWSNQYCKLWDRLNQHIRRFAKPETAK